MSLGFTADRLDAVDVTQTPSSSAGAVPLMWHNPDWDISLA
jgi:hypothetical protein